MPGIDRLLEIYRFAVEHPVERSGRAAGQSREPVRHVARGVRHDQSRRMPRQLLAETGRPGVIQAVRRLGWGVADQGISSLSNFALGLFVARSFGASSFGAFALAFITYTVVINAARGLATDPLLVRFSGDVVNRWRRATSAATGTALVVGVAAGALCVVAGLLLPDPLGPAFVALGIGLPGLALQDSWRFAFFARGRGSSAFLNDLFWTVLLVLALVADARPSRQRGTLSACLRWHGHDRCPARDGSGTSPTTPIPRVGDGFGPTTNCRFGTSSRTSAAVAHPRSVPSCWVRLPASRLSATSGPPRS